MCSQFKVRKKNGSYLFPSQPLCRNTLPAVKRPHRCGLSPRCIFPRRAANARVRSAGRGQPRAHTRRCSWYCKLSRFLECFLICFATTTSHSQKESRTTRERTCWYSPGVHANHGPHAARPRQTSRSTHTHGPSAPANLCEGAGHRLIGSQKQR